MEKRDRTEGVRAQNLTYPDVNLIRIINTLAPKSSSVRGDQLIYAQQFATSINSLGRDELTVSIGLAEERRLMRQGKI